MFKFEQRQWHYEIKYTVSLRGSEYVCVDLMFFIIYSEN